MFCSRFTNSDWKPDKTCSGMRHTNFWWTVSLTGLISAHCRYKYISIVSVGHYTFNFTPPKSLCKYIIHASHSQKKMAVFRALLDQNPVVALLIVIVFTQASYTRSLPQFKQSNLFPKLIDFQYTNQFVRMSYLLKPVAQRVFRNGHAHICQTLQKKTKSHILYINFRAIACRNSGGP